MSGLALFLLAAAAGAAEPTAWTPAVAVRAALEGSPELVRARRELDAAELEEPLLLSNTDPSFVGSFQVEDDRAPRTAPTFQGSRARAERSYAGLAGKTLIGTQARLLVRTDRLESPSLFRTLDPSVDSRLSLEFSQALGRYFWGRPDKARRGRARSGVAAARELLRRAETEAAAAALRALIELDFAARQVAVKEAAVGDAERLLAKQRDKRGYGLVEASDLLQAEASLEGRRTELALARSSLERARSAFVHAAHSSEPAPAAGELAGLPDGAAVIGLGRRPDLAAARSAREAAEWAERVEFLDTLPDIQLSGSYSAAGLAGGYGTSLDDAASFDHGVKTVGLSFALPIGYKKERLTRKAAALRAAQARAEEARVLEAAQRELRDGAEGLRLARERSGLAAKLDDLERRKLAAEEDNYRKGRSSTDLVIRFQQDVRRAETELARARADEALARVELARAAGTLLDGALGARP
ncbi:MAG: TolC family protein [Elusimicrobia bacterium]|nr:TolC family protein [Elusimicrobiota bacterium]